MIIYFVRHASAGKKLRSPKKDERRPLDEEGILQGRYAGRMLANLDVQVEHVISSPLTRALQTASLVANELAFERAIDRSDALRPESQFGDFQSLLAKFRKMVGQNAGTAPAHIEFKKGAVAKVDVNGRIGVLEWLVTPKIARTLQASSKTSSRPKTSRK
jgi:phosphohistidine phosphatase